MTYRPDIDGLRAVAVLAVIGFHAFPSRIPGGFVGVDLFFVISGFLISTIIIEGVEKGSFSFVEFYARRIRRIFPALIVVLVSIMAIGWWVLLPGEYASLEKHVVAGSLFSSNLLLWREAGYFDVVAEQKPLLHLWSLGIEEQFYILWPMVLAMVWRLRKRKIIVIAILAVASFVLNIALISRYPIATFYLPFTRFWELLIGGILAATTVRHGDAIATLLSKRTPYFISTTRNVFSFIGAALIIVSLALLNKRTIFPGFFAILPTMGGALIIAAGPDAWINRRIFSMRIAVFFGIISYPLYLWHWPLLTLLRFLNLHWSYPMRIVAIICSILLSILTYKLVERPFRFGRLVRRKVAVLCSSMLVVMCTGGFIYGHNGMPSRFAGNNKLLGSQVYDPAFQFTSECVETRSNLFSPKFNYKWDFCHSNPSTKKQSDVIVVGDSHANRIYVGLINSDFKNKYLNLGRGSCPPFLGVDPESEDQMRDCQPTTSNILEYSKSSAAKVIVISAFFNGYFDDEMKKMDKDSLQKNVESTFSSLNSAGKKVIIVLDVPQLPFNPTVCVRPIQFSALTACKFPKSIYEKQAGFYKSVLLPLVSKYKNVFIFNPADVLCDESYCFGSIDGSLLYEDTHHLNVTGAKLVANKLITMFTDKPVLSVLSREHP